MNYKKFIFVVFSFLLVFIIKQSNGLIASQVNVTNKTGNFQTAQAFCRTQGMTLIRVENDADNDLLFGLTSTLKVGRYWIDGNNLADQGWVDSNDRPLRYFKWASGEPNNLFGVEHCIEVNAYGNQFWNDMNCAAENGIICKNNESDPLAAKDLEEFSLQSQQRRANSPVNELFNVFNVKDERKRESDEDRKEREKERNDDRAERKKEREEDRKERRKERKEDREERKREREEDRQDRKQNRTKKISILMLRDAEKEEMKKQRKEKEKVELFRKNYENYQRKKQERDEREKDQIIRADTIKQLEKENFYNKMNDQRKREQLQEQSLKADERMIKQRKN